MAKQQIQNSNPRLLMSEILQKVHNAKTKTEKVSLLRQFTSPTLKALMIWNYDESISSALPEGEVPYTKNDVPMGTEHTRLESESRKFYRFCKGGDPGLKSSQREVMFIQLLEGLHESEAEVLCLVKDKKLTDKYRITFNVVQEAFPQIIWGGRTK